MVLDSFGHPVVVTAFGHINKVKILYVEPG